MKFLFFLFVIIIPFFMGKPAIDTKVTLEDNYGRNQINYQTVGEKGRASFQYISTGNYRIVVEFPQQNGKWVKTKPRYNTLTKAAFNTKNDTYFYQGFEGFFSVKLSGFRRIDKENLRPVFHEIKEDGNTKIVITEFFARKNGAQVSLQIKKLTAAQFKWATDKAANDLSLLSIPNIRK